MNDYSVNGFEFGKDGENTMCVRVCVGVSETARERERESDEG